MMCRMPTPLPLVQCCAPLADRHRVKILNRLLAAGGEAVCVCEFQDLLDLKQSSVSYHLKQLLDAGIVQREKRGSFAYFSLTAGALERVRSLLEAPALAA
jgi:ArsR family transcriptional regulator